VTQISEGRQADLKGEDLPEKHAQQQPTVVMGI